MILHFFLYDSFSNTQMKVSLWKSFKTTHVLQFQWDSMICNKSSFKFEDFADYDYIGAPFIYPFVRRGPDFVVYNSGLSLRNVKKIVWLLESTSEGEKKSSMSEDVWFCLFF